jgi:hypothetical protein
MCPDNRSGDTDGHRRVIGEFARCETEWASADHFDGNVGAENWTELVVRTERISTSEADEGTSGADADMAALVAGVSDKSHNFSIR